MIVAIKAALLALASWLDYKSKTAPSNEERIQKEIWKIEDRIFALRKSVDSGDQLFADRLASRILRLSALKGDAANIPAADPAPEGGSAGADG